MPLLPALDLRFNLRVEGLAPDLPFLGPTVRGLLGYGLRQRCCGHAALDDGRCAMGDACAYSFLFEGPLQRRLHDAGISVDALPQPFVLLVPSPAGRHEPMRHISFGIRLLGMATALAPEVVAAIRCRERYGFGARSLGYTLTSVSADGVPIWNRQNDPSVDALEDAARRVAARSGGESATEHPIAPGISTLLWRFHTPVALEESRSDHVNVAAVLLNSAARRAWMLEQAYSPNRLLQRSLPTRIDGHGFVVREARLSPFQFERRSTRHGRLVRLSGLVGSVAIEGPWRLHAQTLAAIRRYGVGQSTSFGFGRVEFEAEPTTAEHARCVTDTPDARRDSPKSTATPLADCKEARSNAPRWIRLRGTPPVKRSRGSITLPGA